ncbi:Arginase [Aphelenchoides bicaudatus]|nr:Arginase [Aphelenchoides bicaudatus]
MKLTVLLNSVGRKLNIVGLANGHGGRHLGCENSLDVLRQSKFAEQCRVPLKWHSFIQETVTGRQESQLDGVIANSRNLSNAVSRQQGDIGLIWVDAHMDAHTIESSPTKNLHGTPVAHLLGFGDQTLRTIGDPYPKIKPQNLCMVGIRSFEDEEQELLNRLGVRVFYDNEVQRRGIYECMLEAIELVSRNTCGFGMSIDLDAFRIKDAPAVGTPEVGGIRAAEFIDFLRDHPNLGNLLATEIVEFMPQKDDLWKRSERLVYDLIESIYIPKIYAQEWEQQVEEKRQHHG